MEEMEACSLESAQNLSIKRVARKLTNSIKLPRFAGLMALKSFYDLYGTGTVLSLWLPKQQKEK
jgi:hypothetical protein